MIRWIILFANIGILLLCSPFITQSTDHIFSYSIFLVLTGIYAFILLGIRKRKQEVPASGKILSGNIMAMTRLKGNPMAMAALIVLTILLYASVLSPFITPHSPIDLNWETVHQKPSLQYWLGTDDLGRDIFSRSIYGLRVALGLSLLAVALNTIMGTTFGLIAGYYGGKVDALIMRILEIINSIPFILLGIALMAALGTGFINLVIVVSISGILPFTRMIRGSVMSIRKQEYLAAAHIIGLPDSKIIRSHVLPNSTAPVIVMSSLKIGTTIIELATLSFLGLGIQPPMPSLGAMLSAGQEYLYTNFMMSLAPGTLILLTVLSFNIFGDGLRDALDTRLKNT